MGEKEGSLNVKSDDREERPPGYYFHSENYLRDEKKRKLKEEKNSTKINCNILYTVMSVILNLY